MNSNEIREAFLHFFETKQHTRVPSSSLVPGNDPTLLFTNAGMVQFKDVFLGEDKRDYNRATSSQRCVRAGGKHNDLENVGYTARHHTFFEMLGNFSFGDYFKEDAIKYAWEFLTGVLKLPEEKLWVTVYKDDKEAEDIWFNTIGIDQQRFSRLGEKDNFWSMGDTGPCGPCSEIFYDHGADVAGGPPGSPDEDGDRYIEIWNLVFMQYNRAADGSLTDLPRPSVDTGMGMERMAAVLQGVHSNYEIDLFQSLITEAASLLKTADRDHKSLRVIADHIRSCAFMIVDGVMPANEGRGYVLRRIMRRALRHGHRLGASDTFLYQMVPALVNVMGQAYPELVKLQGHIEKVIRMEEEQFLQTLDKGMKIFDAAVQSMDGSELSGDIVFKLKDTYGFPEDLTADLAREKNLTIDEQRYEELMQAQKDRSAAKAGFAQNASTAIATDSQTEFLGYDAASNEAKVVALYTVDGPVNQLETAQSGLVILDRSACYAESGGQVGDTGYMSGTDAKVRIVDTQKSADAIVHHIEVVQGLLRAEDVVTVSIDEERRWATTLNHSATHLMHAALREVLGEHVTQKGSLVDNEKLRFDFSHLQAVTAAEIAAIEDRVNETIRENLLVETRLMKPEEAIQQGAMALFGEKYGDTVRVLSMGDFSIELCGGTHVERTGDIGYFKIVAESGVAAGVRRIEALTGTGAMNHVRSLNRRLDAIGAIVKSDAANAEEKVTQLVDRSKRLEKELEQLKAKLASSAGNQLTEQIEKIGGVSVLVARMDGVEPKSLRDTVDQLKNKLGSGLVLLATTKGGKANLVAGVTKDLVKTVKAGDLVNAAAQVVGGKGGGRPDMAMAGGPEGDKIDEALNKAKAWIGDVLG